MVYRKKDKNYSLYLNTQGYRLVCFSELLHAKLASATRADIHLPDYFTKKR